jgi:hypothetical protein
VALILIDLYIPSHILELDFIFLAIVLVFALLTEHTKIEKGEIGTVKAFKNLNYTLLSLPFRNSRTFSTIKFVIFMDAFSFFYYQFFSFDIFKRVMFFIMMFPLSIMTNYGNNIFGYAFKFSINVFSRPVDRRQIIKYYSMLIAIPYFLCLLSSTLFFGFYSNMFWYDIFGYLTVSMILLLVGYMLSLMKPLIIMEDSSWFGGSNQNKIALITSCTITVSWLFLFLLSYQWAFALGFIATFGLLTFIKLKFSVDKVASLAHLLLNQLKNSK